MFHGSILTAVPGTAVITWLIGVAQVSKTALIVDDSRSARVVLKQVLETHDLDVDTAESAEDALDYLIKNRPDVIFMDHLMPGMDGFEAVSAIKRNPQTATIPIMMYTSQEGEVYVGQARALGAVGVLPKKVAPVEVSKVLQSLHIIGAEKQEQSGEQAPPTNETSGEFAALEPLNQDLRTLIQDLFEQQRAVIRRDLLDNYEAIATRFADEIRPPPAEEPDELPLPDERGSSGFMRAAVVVLVVFHNDLRVAVLAKGTKLAGYAGAKRRVAAGIESQSLADAEDSLQVLQQIGAISSRWTTCTQRLSAVSNGVPTRHRNITSATCPSATTG